MSTVITIVEDNTSITLSNTGPQGPTGSTGPANVLNIGTVASGTTAAATITGTTPSQTLNLTLPKGDTGATGPQGPSGVVGVDSGELTNTGTSSSAQLGLATAGTAGTYTKVTTDSFGRVSSGTTLSASDVPSLDPTKITGTAVITSDSRLTDTRTPTDGTVTDSKIASTLSAAKITGTAAVLSVANAFSVGGHVITNAVTSVIPLAIKRVLNQVADLVQYQMSTGTVLGGRNANAQMWTGSATPLSSLVGGATTAATGDGTTATITMTTATNLAVGDIVTVSGITPTGYNGQYVLTGVSNTSPFTVSYANTTTGSQTVAGSVSTPSMVGSAARSLGTLAGAFRAAGSASSTSGNILEVQNSGGNALAFFRGDGAFQNQVDVRSPSFNSTANNFALLAINSGGMLQLKKASAGSPSGTQDYARLALITGTNANTLKLVIAAGNGGAVTTIVDNIPNPA